MLFLAAVRLALSSEDPADASDWLRYGGQVSGSYAKSDPAYFNQLDYIASALRLFRVSLQLELRPFERFAVLTEIRSDNLQRVSAYALYGRFRPWRERVLDVQFGRIPPVFGAFARRHYEVDNPLIGYPLGYQYATSVRPDAAPADLDELRRNRGRGAKTRYSVGSPDVATGMPVVHPLEWDTGVSLRIGDRPLELAVALTQGTLGNPSVLDDNPGKQWSARFAWRPSPALVAAVSAARGRYDEAPLRRALEERGLQTSAHQTALGLDVEASAGAWIVRSEAMLNRWDSPTLGTGLDSVAAFVEGRYKIAPAWYVAARWDHLGFAEVGHAGERFSWDAPVRRFEAGAGYYWRRFVLTKLTVQHNRRDGVQTDTFVAVQALWWF